MGKKGHKKEDVTEEEKKVNEALIVKNITTDHLVTLLTFVKDHQDTDKQLHIKKNEKL